MRPCSRGGMRRLTALRGHDRIRLLSLSVILSHADVAELADALDLGSSAARRMGSTPFIRTILAHLSDCFAVGFFSGSTSNVTDMRAPRKRLVAQAFVCLYAQIPPDFLNALRLNERSPAGRTAHFSRLLH